MKRMKLFAVLLVLMLLSSAATLAEEQSSWQYDDSNFRLKVKGVLTGDVSVPSEINDFPVTALESNAFYEQHEITALSLPESLRAVQSGAISTMDCLTSVTLNDGLEVIGNGNFNHCPMLTSLTIPASVCVFNGSVGQCENLKEIRFEGKCPIFLNTDFCFWWMPDEYTIYVPDDQLDAYAAALADCNDAAMHLQPSGRNAASAPAENPEAWYVFDAATGTITGYQAYHAFLDIPAFIDGVPVKVIGKDAFRSDYTVYGVVFPEGLERIESGAFKAASNIDYIRFPSTLHTIGGEAFFNVQSARIDWSEGLKEIGVRAFQYDHSHVLALPSTVTTIGESAFEGSRCTELSLGSNVTHIGSRAFADCGLSYAALDAYTIIDMAADAFADNPLTDIDLPWNSSIANRDAYAALLAEHNPSCTVWVNNPPAEVAEDPINDLEITTIENGVWTAYHGSQPDLTIWTEYDGISVTALGDGLFMGNQSIRSFYPHHCGWFSTIGKEAFADSSVEYVELFGSITTIGDEAFRNCVNLTAVTLPDSLTTIGTGAFKGCTGLTELTLPSSLTSVGEGLLDGCDHLAKLTVLCDPSILPENLLEGCFARVEIYAAADAIKEQVAILSALAHRPWYAPISRLGEPIHDLTEMPYAMLPISDFWYDTTYARLDRYNGYELNLYLPREVDGTELPMIGGGMMDRARDTGFSQPELPVRSVVIPENYTTIVEYCFAGCDSLETIICYAPIENLESHMFDGCFNLREVVFVNGVRNIGDYAFADCPSLKTVYLGPYVERVSENAFLNEDGSQCFSLAQCITDAAQMPDVDALIQAVRSDPMPTPEPTATPSPAPVARPIGAEGEAFLGTWILESVEMGGEAFDPAMFGITMTLTLNADGTAVSFDGMDTVDAVWYVENGIAMADGAPLTLNEDGKLVTSSDEIAMVFAHGESAATTAPQGGAFDPGSTSADNRLEIKYVCTSAEVSGFTMDASTLGGEYSLLFHGDGTVEIVLAGTPIPSLKWVQETVQTESGEATAFVIDYYGETRMEATWTEAGFDMNYFDAMLLHLTAEK